MAETDAATAFEAWLAAAPRHNRTALRAALHALELAPHAAGRPRFRRLDRAGRLAILRALQHSRVPLVPQLAEALRAAALMSYHGDALVMTALGYDAAARVSAVRARRAAARPAARPRDARRRGRYHRLLLPSAPARPCRRTSA